MISLPVVLSVGCGRVFPGNMDFAPANSLVTNNSTSNQITAKYSCPGVPNVHPNMEITLDGSDHFTVCTSKTLGNFSDLLITGRFSSSNSLCAIPVQMLSSGQFKAKLDTQGNPVFSCSAPTADGVLISNPMADSASFNSIIIVESPDLNSLISCIANNYTDCPNYSFGKIR